MYMGSLIMRQKGAAWCIGIGVCCGMFRVEDNEGQLRAEVGFGGRGFRASGSKGRVFWVLCLGFRVPAFRV